MDQAPEIKRDWVLPCDGNRGRVFEMGVTLGAVELHLPDGADCIRLERQQVAAFRAALAEAVVCADDDLRVASNGHGPE
ncbi:hypothetical protein [Saccharothrix obliqua]|uniref:hypothetical protein n=1 Tax=Saccharothrix obliqua TaxID=2861747 RepID=UPI001C5D6B81|nr:hypothetical protein [Saccharothrix obliqua]MBW4719012.1 hypothetical protein [Saccharothrix obliqua]